MTYDEKLAERIRGKLKSRRGLAEKKMFGGVGFLINGNIACGVNKQDLIVRLSHEEFQKAIKRAHVRVFDMTGRPMKGWIVVAPAGMSTERTLQDWIDNSVEFARSLPPK